MIYRSSLKSQRQKIPNWPFVIDPFSFRELVISSMVCDDDCMESLLTAIAEKCRDQPEIDLNVVVRNLFIEKSQLLMRQQHYVERSQPSPVDDPEYMLPW